MDREARKAELIKIAQECGGAVEQFMTHPPRPIGVRIDLDRLEEFVRKAAAAIEEPFTPLPPGQQWPMADTICPQCDGLGAIVSSSTIKEQDNGS